MTTATIPTIPSCRSVAVIGVGTMGAMTAWHLAEAGLAVTGFERHGVPHDRGAHGAETRIYRLAYREGPEYLPLLRYSYDRWLELTSSSHKPVYTQNGCLYISDLQTPWLAETITAAEAYGVPIIELDDAALAARYPQHRLQGGERAILDLLGGTLRPEMAVLAAADRARELGAVIEEYTTVVSVEAKSDGVSIMTKDGRRLQFDHAVVTTGAWTGDFQRSHGFGITARRLPGTWYAAEQPSDFLPHRFPVCIRTAGDIEYSGFPSVDGWSVKVMPPVFPDTDTLAEEVDREIRPGDITYTQRVVRELLNGLRPNPVRTGVYLDGFAATETPIIDYSQESDRVVGAVGFAGHGFKMSPAIGALLTELILTSAGAPAELPLSAFRVPFKREPRTV